MLELHVDVDERNAGQLRPERHEAAVRALKEDGYVVLTGLIDPSHVETLRTAMLADVERLLARKDRPFNWVSGNLQQNPPPQAQYLFRDVLVNDVVISVTKALLGSGLKCAFYSGNTALPSESRQPVHADLGQLWPNLPQAHPPYGIVVNIPLVDMDERNGSTEIWPGTHLDTTVAWQDGDITVSQEALAARRRVSPPLQPAVKAGSFLIRDIRMWHAGMPNRTQNPRPMMAMIHNVSWWPTSPVRFPKSTEEIFRHPDLFWHVEHTEQAIDHISEPQAYEFQEEA